MALAEALPALENDPGLTQSRGELSRARHLPGYVYHSEEIFRLEKQKIFMKDWLAMARVEEFERAGDYRTFRVMGEPVIVCRDGEGAISAFANVCAHRGVEVASGEGNLEEFSCPYHGWLYDLQGKLIGAPYMKEAASSPCAPASGRAGFSSISTTTRRRSSPSSNGSTAPSASSAWRTAAAPASTRPSSTATGSWSTRT
ncbi:MAG: Rieske (2Fe-2S) protein [Alphaproteobacteria bacterium]|nr:Rieske (2Fe-2S) protein [Alphaproteobacteria bacterium]